MAICPLLPSPPSEKIKRESSSWGSLGQNSKRVIFNRLLGKRLILDPVKKSSSTDVLVREVCVLTIRQELLQQQLSNLKYSLPLKTSLASHVLGVLFVFCWLVCSFKVSISMPWSRTLKLKWPFVGYLAIKKAQLVIFQKFPSLVQECAEIPNEHLRFS